MLTCLVIVKMSKEKGIFGPTFKLALVDQIKIELKVAMDRTFHEVPAKLNFKKEFSSLESLSTQAHNMEMIA